MTDEWSPPSWVYKDNRPSSDQEYFENLTRCIFQGGLNWQLIANKWHNFQKAFNNFNIKKVAAYGQADIKRLSDDKGIIRNKNKITSTIYNAQEFEQIIKNHDSFQKWLDGLDKANNYDAVVKQLVSRFKRVGASTAHIFLWSVGEDIKYDPSMHTRRPTKIV
jgi:DNA-3-methyladenine glycosylase I